MTPAILMDHWRLITGLQLLAGVCAARWAYRRTGSVVWSSAAFTLCFSFGLVVYRLAFPAPTFSLLVLRVLDALEPKDPCPVRDSDGCFDPGDSADSFIVCPG